MSIQDGSIPIDNIVIKLKILADCYYFIYVFTPA